MKTNNNWNLIWIHLLSTISFIFASVAGYNVLNGTATTEILVVGLFILAAIQVVIAIIAVWSGDY